MRHTCIYYDYISFIVFNMFVFPVVFNNNNNNNIDCRLCCNIIKKKLKDKKFCIFFSELFDSSLKK